MYFYFVLPGCCIQPVVLVLTLERHYAFRRQSAMGYYPKLNVGGPLPPASDGPGEIR